MSQKKAISLSYSPGLQVTIHIEDGTHKIYDMYDLINHTGEDSLLNDLFSSCFCEKEYAGCEDEIPFADQIMRLGLTLPKHSNWKECLAMHVVIGCLNTVRYATNIVDGAELTYVGANHYLYLLSEFLPLVDLGFKCVIDRMIEVGLKILGLVDMSQ